MRFLNRITGGTVTSDRHLGYPYVQLPDEVVPVPSESGLTAGSVAEVLDRVGGDRVRILVALTAEQDAPRPRVSLIRALGARLA